MRIIAARKHKFGFELPHPDSVENLEILAHINLLISKRSAIFNSNISNGSASYKLYTDDEILGEELTQFFNRFC